MLIDCLPEAVCELLIFPAPMIPIITCAFKKFYHVHMAVLIKLILSAAMIRLWIF